MQVERWIRDLILESPASNFMSGGTSGGSSSSSQASGGSVSGSSGGGRSAQHPSSSALVKRVLLVDVVRLCVFFGQEKSMDLLLGYLLSFLQDQVR